MKAKKKRVETKAQIRAVKERERRIATAIFLGFILLMIILSAYLTYTFLNQSPDQSLIEPTLQFKPENPNPQLKAAIIDHLSLTIPNQTFIQTVAHILTEVDYTVDYYPHEKVTVELYRNLPSKGYGVILLRVHSGNNQYDKGPNFLWTSEPYSTSKYVHEQLTDQLRPTGSLIEDWPTVFSIGPEFVRKSMQGHFQNSIIIAMGCETLKDTDLATAFIEKGASAYIGWSEDVESSHTDTATTQLLQHLLTEKQTIKQAVSETMKEAGPDPTYKSLLIYYPLEVGEQTIENIKGNSTTKP